MTLLKDLSINVLKEISSDYINKIEAEEKIFSNHRNRIIEEIKKVYKSYLIKLHVKRDLLSDTEERLVSDLKLTDSVENLNAILLQGIERVAEYELTMGLSSKEGISVFLREKYNELCIQGLLPRNFEKQVRPILIKIVEDAFNEYLKDTEASGDKEYNQIFSNFRENIKTCLNEESLEKELEIAISGISIVRISKGRAFSYFSWFNSTERKLIKSFFAIKESLKSKGFLKVPSIPGQELPILRSKINNLEIFIENKEKHYSQEMDKIKKKNRVILNDLTDKNILFSQKQFLARYSQKFINILEKKREENQVSVSNLRKELCDFWSDISIECEEKYYESSPMEVDDWNELNCRIRKYRNELILEGHLLKGYREDNRFHLVNLYRVILKKTYNGTLGSIGRIRQQQINNLYIKLVKTHNEKEARIIIEKAIFDIKKNHETTSLAYNLYRKSSRSVRALEQLLQEAEKQELLIKRDVSKIKPISQIIEERLDQDYFETDFIKNSRSRQYAKYALLEKVRDLEEKMTNGKLRESTLKQAVTQYIDDTLKTTELQHKAGERVNRILRYFKIPSASRFCQYLNNIRDQLLNEGRIEVSYKEMVWPKIRTELQSTLDDFRDLDLPSRPDSIFNLFDKKEEAMYKDEQQEAIFQAGELLSQLSKAEDAELASYILNQGIKVLSEPYPPLAQLLKLAQQHLEQKRLIPVYEKSVFSSEYLSKLAAERDKIRQAIKDTKQVALAFKEKLETLKI